jgi:hypothetical protein
MLGRVCAEWQPRAKKMGGYDIWATKLSCSPPAPLGGVHKRLMTRPYRRLMPSPILPFLARRLSWWRSRRKVLSEVAYAVDREIGHINRRGLTGSRRRIRISRRHRPFRAYHAKSPRQENYNHSNHLLRIGNFGCVASAFPPSKHLLNSQKTFPWRMRPSRAWHSLIWKFMTRCPVANCHRCGTYR